MILPLLLFFYIQFLKLPSSIPHNPNKIFNPCKGNPIILPSSLFLAAKFWRSKLKTIGNMNMDIMFSFVTVIILIKNI
jgi:hypothetical protein